jgi:glucan phosphoethanolaminetransferase (alkaline phosphatase superfamily)
MRSIERWTIIAQITAAVGLATAFFLPFYRSAAGDISHADEWLLFFWTVPAIVLLHFVSKRWLKASLCWLAIIAGAITLGMLTFLASFKSTPQVGFYLARASLVILMSGWLVLSVVTLRRTGPKA